MAQPRRAPAKKAPAGAPIEMPKAWPQTAAERQNELVALHMIVAEPMFGPVPPRVISCKHCGGVVWNVEVHLQSQHPELLLADTPEDE